MSRAGAAFVAVASVIVGCAIVAGVLVVGPPWEARKQKLDEIRVRDLMQLTFKIDQYFLVNKVLPESLADLLKSPSTTPSNWKDPETGSAYDYLPRSPPDYQLCATFQTKVQSEKLLPGHVGWQHSAGRQCFDLKVPTK
jgi:hypothetical protein